MQSHNVSSIGVRATLLVKKNIVEVKQEKMNTHTHLTDAAYLPILFLLKDLSIV